MVAREVPLKPKLKSVLPALPPILLFVVTMMLIMRFTVAGLTEPDNPWARFADKSALLFRTSTRAVPGTGSAAPFPADSSAKPDDGATASAAPTSFPSAAPTPLPTPPPTPAPTPTPAPVRITLTAIGDILLHQSVIDGGLQADGTYNYDHAFSDTRDLLSGADYTLANYEGTLAGPPYSGYPLFGGPDAIATAMRMAGIDVAVTANNHCLDRRLAGVIRTPQAFAEAGIATVGTRSKPEDPTYVLRDVGGVQVGITAWTWETIGTPTQRAINGIPLPREAEPLIDSFNPSRPERYARDLEAMAARVRDMRAAGAECVVFVPHWGEEYVTASNKRQRDMARFLSDAGVDVIFGIHPHVLQEAELLHSEQTGRDTLVFYSLGGFLSNMDYGTHGTDGHALDAIIASATVERAPDGTVRVVSGGYVGTTIVREKEGGKTRHRVLPVMAALSAPEAHDATRWLDALEKARVRTDKVFAQSRNLSADGAIPFHFDVPVPTAESVP
jgi:poly-gamma-glutamate synthesis protein (capsule biosynthesis protein)